MHITANWTPTTFKNTFMHTLNVCLYLIPMYAFLFASETSNFLHSLPNEIRSFIQDTWDGSNKPKDLLLPCPS